VAEAEDETNKGLLSPLPGTPPLSKQVESGLQGFAQAIQALSRLDDNSILGLVNQARPEG
jgi:hypothetical protein